MRGPLVLMFLLVGCAPNAVLELEFGLPQDAPESDSSYVLVQARAEDRFLPFASEWEPVHLGQGVPASDGVERVSLTSSTEVSGVRVKVRVCEAPDCSDSISAMISDSREFHFELEHPFFLGHRTSWRFDFNEDMLLTGLGTNPCRAQAEDSTLGQLDPCNPANGSEMVPGEPLVVSRCLIRGCLDTGQLNTGYCLADDPGRHICEGSD